MNTSELVDGMASCSGMTKAEARRGVEAMAACLKAAASRGDSVAVSGIGSFKVRDMPAREGRNPSTGAKMQIAASRKVSFSPAKALKDAAAAR